MLGAVTLTIQGGAGHVDDVVAVAVSEDEKTAVSGSWDKTLKVWDLETGSER